MPHRSTVYNAYQRLSEQYSELIETKPHNAYYERPAMMEMWPDLEGQRVLDAGCGPGLYTEKLLERRANVTAFDFSERMIGQARKRVGEHADLRLVDMTQPLEVFHRNQFDFINAPLCIDYVKDWRSLFKEFKRILKPGGLFQFSCGHPAFDAQYYNTSKYFDVEHVECTWTGFGIEVVMPSYRRPLQEIIMPLIDNDFQVRQVVEPLPTAEFKKNDFLRSLSLVRRPAFLCIQSVCEKQDPG